MPRYPIERATNFIVEDESWTVVEYDHTSVPGVIYLSLTEGKVNLIYDDTVNNIADTDKLAQYSLSVPSETQVFNVGDIIELVFTLTKNGEPSDMEVELIPQDKTIVKLVNGVLTAVGEGTTSIVVQLKDVPNISNVLNIQVGGEPIVSAYIKGIENIRLDRYANYELIGTNEVIGEVNFSIDKKELATIISVDSNKCVILANNKNLLGSFTLTAVWNNVEYTKVLKVIPLW